MDRNEFLSNQGYSDAFLKALSDYENLVKDDQIKTAVSQVEVKVNTYDIATSDIQIRSNENFKTQISNF